LTGVFQSVRRHSPHCVFHKKKGQAAIDQIRSLDKIRLVKKPGILNEQYCKMACKTLLEYFRLSELNKLATLMTQDSETWFEIFEGFSWIVSF
jgi:hypothetical protein